jgi:hypothetical protein
MTMKIIGGLGLGGLGLGLALGSACVETRLADHCANLDGDADCARRYPDGARPYCVLGTCEMENLDGCYAARPSDDACYSPCGEDKSLADDPGCDGLAETGTDSTSVSTSQSETTPTDATDEGTLTTTGTPSGSETEETSATDATTTGASGCVSSRECSDRGTPICEDEVCVACTDAADGDAACASKDAGSPACGSDGACVECTDGNPSACAGETPVCDVAGSTCVGCTYHEQCAGEPLGACDMATGACFEGCVIEVDGDGGADTTTIEAALADGCVVIVHELDGGADYNETLEVDGLTVALLGAPGESPVVQGTGGSATLSVGGDANVYVQELTFSLNGSAEGVAVDAASVWLDRSRVVQNTGGGITVAGGGTATVRNCFVGGDVSDIAAIDVAGSTAAILYSTLGGGFGSAAALRCDGASMVDIRNALLVARTDDPELDCVTDSVTRTITEADVGDMSTGWFGGYATGNFGLLPAAPDDILTAARWNTGDPAVDIDGQSRPDVDGTPDVAGADVP